MQLSKITAQPKYKYQTNKIKVKKNWEKMLNLQCFQ